MLCDVGAYEVMGSSAHLQYSSCEHHIGAQTADDHKLANPLQKRRGSVCNSCLTDPTAMCRLFVHSFPQIVPEMAQH
jgi:hypothetical protein